jgi:hypothetical protein
MAEQEHGVSVLLRQLRELDRKTIHVTVARSGKDRTEFDRAVRESMDRIHRRQVIAGG